MHIGDKVYVYLFDLVKSINQLEKLREDRFGTIKDISILKRADNSYNDVIVYKIELNNGTTITYKTDNVNTNIIDMESLLLTINEAVMDESKKEYFIAQVQTFICKNS